MFNAKTRRVSVCNALDCLIIHRERLSDLASLCKPLSEKNVLIYADPKAYGALAGKYPESLLQPATDDSFGTEFLDYKMAIKTVDSFEEALAHIAHYSSKHSESIITEKRIHNNASLTKSMPHAYTPTCLPHSPMEDNSDSGQK